MGEMGDWILRQEFDDKANEHWNIWSCPSCGYIKTDGWEYTRDGQKPKVKYCENCGQRIV